MRDFRGRCSTWAQFHHHELLRHTSQNAMSHVNFVNGIMFISAKLRFVGKPHFLSLKTSKLSKTSVSLGVSQHA